MVRKGGLEPPCLSAPPPQDGVSANSTTSALKSLTYMETSWLQKHLPSINRPATLPHYVSSNSLKRNGAAAPDLAPSSCSLILMEVKRNSASAGCSSSHY